MTTQRLKFENVLTVVPLPYLARISIASLTADSAGKAAKIVVRHKIASVRAEGCVSQQSSTKSWRESSYSEWKRPRGLLAWLWSGWIDYVVVQHFSRSVTIFFSCFTPNSVLVLFLVLCEVSIQVFVHVRVQAKNSSGTTMTTFSNFNLLRGRCTLLLFPSTLTTLCATAYTRTGAMKITLVRGSLRLAPISYHSNCRGRDRWGSVTSKHLLWVMPSPWQPTAGVWVLCTHKVSHEHTSENWLNHIPLHWLPTTSAIHNTCMCEGSGDTNQLTAYLVKV